MLLNNNLLFILKLIKKATSVRINELIGKIENQ